MNLLAVRVLPGRLFAVAILAACLGVPSVYYGQNQSTSSPTSDNSANNKSSAMTADQQSEAFADRMLTQKIRKAIMADKSLSAYAHNVKIITRGGAVNLKGPVHSNDEKQNIGALAANAAGGPDKVTNQLTVKQ